MALPKELPRIEIRHEPDFTICSLRRIGEDVSEKPDYSPGVVQVERCIGGKWACSRGGTLIKAPVPLPTINKGIAMTGLLGQVLVA